MLKVTDVYKKYGKKIILQGVSFEAGAGECIGIVGGNGCGKTTLLSILAGVIRPERGSICFHGTEAAGRDKIFARYAAYVPQEPPILPELTAYDNYRLWFRGDKRRLEENLYQGVGSRLGLREFMKTPAGKLSGGQKKRLSIASALADCTLHSSAADYVLILDEPGAALDLEAKEAILDYIAEYRSQGGCVVLTSHEMWELSACTGMYILKNGILHPSEPGISAEELIRRF